MSLDDIGYCFGLGGKGMNVFQNAGSNWTLQVCDRIEETMLEGATTSRFTNLYDAEGGPEDTVVRRVGAPFLPIFPLPFLYI